MSKQQASLKPRGESQQQKQDRQLEVLQVSHSLFTLGAPSISTEDFNRLYQGSFAELLLFMSTHIKGRYQVSKHRHIIQHVRSASPSNALSHDVYHSTVLRSNTELRRAEKELNELDSRLKGRQVELHHACSEISHLNQVLRSKRHVLFLLNILEQRERLRLSQFRELVARLGNLRSVSYLRQTTASNYESSVAVIKPENILSGFATPPTSKASCTQETITNLHAYHSRLYRIKNSEYEPTRSLILRLRLRLSNVLPANEIEDVLEECCRIARVKAQRRIKYHDALMSTLPDASNEELIDKAKINQLRRMSLQKLSDRAVALGFLCEHLIAAMSLFFGEASPVLQLSVQEDVSSIKGYVDVLRLRLSVAATNMGTERRSFAEEIRNACSMITPTDSEDVIQSIKKLLQRCKGQSSYSAKVDTLRVSPQRPDRSALIAQCRASADIVEQGTRTLLTRKVEKAAQGESLIEDIETLMKDAKLLVK